MSKSKLPQLKVRREARLKNLPEDRQREVFHLCRSLKYSECRVVIEARFGFKISSTGLSNFFHWYQKAVELREAHRKALAALDQKEILQRRLAVRVFNDLQSLRTDLLEIAKHGCQVVSEVCNCRQCAARRLISLISHVAEEQEKVTALNILAVAGEITGALNEHNQNRNNS